MPAAAATTGNVSPRTPVGITNFIKHGVRLDHNHEGPWLSVDQTKSRFNGILKNGHYFVTTTKMHVLLGLLNTPPSWPGRVVPPHFGMFLEMGKDEPDARIWTCLALVP